jgi:hypothetical protein
MTPLTEKIRQMFITGWSWGLLLNWAAGKGGSRINRQTGDLRDRRLNVLGRGIDALVPNRELKRETHSFSRL